MCGINNSKDLGVPHQYKSQKTLQDIIKHAVKTTIPNHSVDVIIASVQVSLLDIYSIMDGSTLPANVQCFIKSRQATPEWRTNAYRKDGVLRPGAFEKAYEIYIHAVDWKERRYVAAHPAWSKSDLRDVVRKQTPELWEQSPWSHYNVTSTIFTLEELAHYVSPFYRAKQPTS